MKTLNYTVGWVRQLSVHGGGLVTRELSNDWLELFERLEKSEKQASPFLQGQLDAQRELTSKAENKLVEYRALHIHQADTITNLLAKDRVAENAIVGLEERLKNALDTIEMQRDTFNFAQDLNNKLRHELEKLQPAEPKFRVGQFVAPNSHVGAYEIERFEYVGGVYRYMLVGLGPYGWHSEWNLNILKPEQI